MFTDPKTIIISLLTENIGNIFFIIISQYALRFSQHNLKITPEQKYFYTNETCLPILAFLELLNGRSFQYIGWSTVM